MHLPVWETGLLTAWTRAAGASNAVNPTAVPIAGTQLHEGTAEKMDEWIDYYDSTHTIYASKLHRDLHFQLIAKDIIGYIASPDAVVLDYACGEALFAAKVAEACGKLILAEPAPGVRGRLDRSLRTEHENHACVRSMICGRWWRNRSIWW